MLKRHRPITPPPSSLGDLPSFLPNGPTRPLLPTEPLQPRVKRQRTQPPPLDGTLRGWLASEHSGPQWESDGEEDWIEDPHSRMGSPSLFSSTSSQYKDANSFLHQLHVLNQHRLLFAHPSRGSRASINSVIQPPHTPSQDPLVGERPAAWTSGSPYHPLPQSACVGHADHGCHGFSGEKGLAEEVQCVRQRYQGTNRFLGSLFLSRRREVEETISSADFSRHHP